MKYLNTLLILSIISLSSCDDNNKTVSSSGATLQEVKITTDNDGWTIEQKNIARRLQIDNTPGSIKHLYIISPYSGQTILYSTVKGKVTSSGKRLKPTTVSDNNTRRLPGIYIDKHILKTNEVLQDDGSYGSSCEYIFWFDQKDSYHQHFFTGGQIIHVSDQPMPIKNITINLENN